MDEAQKVVAKFAEDRDWRQFHTPENLAKSIAIEAGELLECFQWNNNCDKETICDELADVMTYCLHMANVLGVKPEDIILSKMKKNAAKYPIEKAKGNAKKYTEL